MGKQSLQRVVPILVVLGALLTLTGCSTVKPEQYRDQRPELRIEQYFLGDTRAWGIVQDRAGNVKRRFQVDLFGQWEDDEFKLSEYFRFSDGETDTRTWYIRPDGEHGYEGRAGDVDGVATGTAYGNALNWQYVLFLPVKGKTWRVKFDDWMFLQEDGVLVNRATLSKFGIRLGEITIFFTRNADDTKGPDK